MPARFVPEFPWAGVPLSTLGWCPLVNLVSPCQPWAGVPLSTGEERYCLMLAWAVHGGPGRNMRRLAQHQHLAHWRLHAPLVASLNPAPPCTQYTWRLRRMLPSLRLAPDPTENRHMLQCRTCPCPLYPGRGSMPLVPTHAACLCMCICDCAPCGCLWGACRRHGHGSERPQGLRGRLAQQRA